MKKYLVAILVISLLVIAGCKSGTTDTGTDTGTNGDSDTGSSGGSVPGSLIGKWMLVDTYTNGVKDGPDSFAVKAREPGYYREFTSSEICTGGSKTARKCTPVTVTDSQIITHATINGRAVDLPAGYELNGNMLSYYLGSDPNLGVREVLQKA